MQKGKGKRDKIIEELKHEWKHHKSSNILLIVGAIFCVSFVIIATQNYKQEYVLPETTQTLLLTVISGSVLFLIYSKISEQMRENEKKKINVR